MEIFSSLDLFEVNEAPEKPPDREEVERRGYSPRRCSTDPLSPEPPQADENGLKMLADRRYLTKEFGEAAGLYTQLLRGRGCGGSAAMKRDITECLGIYQPNLMSSRSMYVPKIRCV